MKISEILKKDISKELFDQVVAAVGEDRDYDLVPRARLNEVIAQRDDEKAKAAEYKKAADTAEAATAKVTDLETKLAAKDAEHSKVLSEKEAAVKTANRTADIKEKLFANKVKNVTAVMALIKEDTLGDDLAGLDKEVERIKTSDPYLFGENIVGGTGADGAGDGKENPEAPATLLGALQEKFTTK